MFDFSLVLNVEVWWPRPPFDNNDDQVHGDTPLKYLVIIKLIALKVDPQPLGIHNMVNAIPRPVVWFIPRPHETL